MPQLTGTFTGTNGADTFSGSINNTETTVIDGVVTGSAIQQFTVDTFDGNDIIEAATIFFAAPVLAANAIGMTNADINTGGGGDTVTLVSNANSLKSTISTGLQNSFIETQAGRDVITVSSTGKASFAGGSVPATSTGISFTTINAGTDNDLIKVDSFAAGTPAEGRGSSTDIGIDQTTLLGEGGNDTIAIASVAEGGSDSGADVSSTGTAGDSSINGGSGRDIITISANATDNGAISRPSVSTAKGISDGSFVEGGGGSDTITINALAKGGRVLASRNDGGIAESYGAIDSFVMGGRGRDTIKISSAAETVGDSPNSLVCGILNTTVDGGDGSDVIEIKTSGSAEGSNGTRHGAVNSTINGGRGNDSIEVSVAQGENIADSVGVLNSAIDAGSGRDNIKAIGLKFDIQDSLILGGGGQDTFDTGIGQGTILGGSGSDVLKLDFFDQATMSITQLDTNGIGITGTQDKTGASADWTQTIFGVESYEVAGTTYNAASVVDLLS